MNRRDFIRTGAVAGMASTGMLQGACSSIISHQPSVTDRVRNLDMKTYLANLDATMGHVGGFTCDESRCDEPADQIGSAAVRSLCISSMFRDLPLEGQLHPGMQRRLWASMDQMDRAVFGNSVLIAQSGLVRDKEVIAAIKGPDNPGMAFLERFDRQAASVNLSRRKRFRLRSIGIDVVRQMRRKSPEYVFCEAWEKADQMRRTVEMCGSVQEADRRATIMRIGHDGYAAREREVSDIIQQWNSVALLSNDPNADAYAKADLDSANRLIKAGAWTLGVAGIVAAIGGLLALVDPMVTLIVSGTVGGILLIVGLIILSVGAAKKNRILKAHPELALKPDPRQATALFGK
jgi:hypothetical protein